MASTAGHRLPSRAETVKTRHVRPVTVTGEAIIAAEPNQAQIDIGVVTQARTAPEVASMLWLSATDDPRITRSPTTAGGEVNSR